MLTPAVLTFALIGTPAPQETPPWLSRAYDLARAEYDGDRAHAIVAEVAPRWRWPGNRSFNDSVRLVAAHLRSAGYVDEAAAPPDAPLVYRIESREMRGDSWEPLDATLRIEGEDEPIQTFAANWNMVAIGSESTHGPVTATLVDVGAGRRSDFDGIDVTGCIVMGDAPPWQLARQAMRRGAVGILSHGLADYNQPEVYRDSIQFRTLGPAGETGGWAVLLSRRTRDRLRAACADGPTSVTVDILTRIEPSRELTLVAEARGAVARHERVVLSAHVQEPGANDNASGVGCLAEAARVFARYVAEGTWRPDRTITMIWGDEISAPARYLREDDERREGVKWGISLDMVGEDTSKTGGTFLIEKMPDPSAIWTRGEDQHSEWGGRPLGVDDMMPHWLNDFVIARCEDEARDTGWVVKTNPYEGGSDHVPFLQADKPSVLLWHFTDVFYHTDGDTIEMVSPKTLRHVGVSTVVIAAILATPSDTSAQFILDEIAAAAFARLDAEAALSREAISGGAEVAAEQRIIQTWTDWYIEAAASVTDLEIGGPSDETVEHVTTVVARIGAHGRHLAEQLQE